MEKRDILVKKEAKSDARFGCKPEERTVAELIDYGVINLDKPRGPTSHQVSEYAQRILGIRKAGHSGTLDPNVSGVLPIATGRATRIVQTLLTAGKEYVAIMHIHTDVDEKAIRRVFKKFVGKITQVPPIKAAVKRRARQREIYSIEILEVDGRDVLFRVNCEAGTYIRKLIHDIALKMGTRGHMAELRRTRVACFDEKTLVTLHDLADAYWFWKNEGNEKYIRHCIKPVEAATCHLGKIWVLDSAVDTICHGADLKVPGISRIESSISIGNTVAIMTLKDELVAIGTARMASEDIMKSDNGVVAKTSKVFMLPRVYAVRKD